MQRPAPPETDPAADLAPPIQHHAPWRIRAITNVTGMSFHVEFVDATAGEVDMSRLLASPKVKGTVFEPLRDPSNFMKLQVVLGAVQWPNGADLAPDAMYDAIRSQGRWVPE